MPSWYDKAPARWFLLRLRHVPSAQDQCRLVQVGSTLSLFSWFKSTCRKDFCASSIFVQVCGGRAFVGQTAGRRDDPGTEKGYLQVPSPPPPNPPSSLPPFPSFPPPPHHHGRKEDFRLLQKFIFKLTKSPSLSLLTIFIQAHYCSFDSNDQQWPSLHHTHHVQGK